ncbi:MAG TPA: DUF1446 domain-containing protein [Candidatus Merdenecus merdavium]|nr:DUF1446 domain-containing protein [Candidatus Merdenecus merdavium]
MKKVRLGSGAGYAGDRIEPAIELLEKGNLDYIIFECLAERTIALGQRDKEKDATKGYNQLIEYRMKKVLPLLKEKKVKMITNMGSANPEEAGMITASLAKELGIEGLKIVTVSGDDILPRIENYYENPILEMEKKLSDMKEEIISANAYMGCEGILKALELGADIVITGRVSDPALTIAPLVYEFGWNLENNPKEMGQCVLAGHLLECAGQVTGGYYADPGYKNIDRLEYLGFPLVEIDETGEFIVTKVEGSGGMVAVDICKEQVIYEIHNPKRYLTPDAIADFSQVQFIQEGVDRVKVMNANSVGKPENLKVSVGYKDCYIGTGEISYGGSNSLERARMAADIVRKRLEIIKAEVEELRIDYIGYNSLYQGKETLKRYQSFPEIRLRVCGRTKDIENARLIGNEVETLYTNGPAGGAGVTKTVEDVVSICSIFVPREAVQYQLKVLEV